MIDYKLKIYNLKELEQKQEELVNYIFNINASYESSMFYTENIAQIVSDKKKEIENKIDGYFGEEVSKTFCCVMLVEDKPVAYCVCKETLDHWDILKIVCAADMQNKGYEYVSQKNCVSQIKINNGKTVT